MHPMRRLACLSLVAALTAGCTSGDADDGAPTATPGQPTSGTAAPESPTGTADGEPSEAADPPESSEPPEGTESPEVTDPAETTEPPEPVRFDNDRAMADVRHLALRIGRREATSRAYARAADWVQRQFTGLGYDVSRQRVPVPAGNSWGIDVPAGVSVNVVADPAGFDPSKPHVVVGAHLDTVPQAPGAEDNASGVATVLELARLVADRGVDVPVRFVAFGAEEPRGEGDALHHFGSMRYVELMSPAERRALLAMVSLDRVGTRGPYVPACSGPGGDTGVRDRLARSARASGMAVRLCDDNTTSDHWSFTKAGLPSARLGSIDYDEYHSSADLPRVVDPTQLQRVGRTMWHWLRSTRPRS